MCRKLLLYAPIYLVSMNKLSVWLILIENLLFSLDCVHKSIFYMPMPARSISHSLTLGDYKYLQRTGFRKVPRHLFWSIRSRKADYFQSFSYNPIPHKGTIPYWAE